MNYSSITYLNFLSDPSDNPLTGIAYHNLRESKIIKNENLISCAMEWAFAYLLSKIDESKSIYLTAAYVLNGISPCISDFTIENLGEDTKQVNNLIAKIKNPRQEAILAYISTNPHPLHNSNRHHDLSQDFTNEIAVFNGKIGNAIHSVLDLKMLMKKILKDYKDRQPKKKAGDCSILLQLHVVNVTIHN